MGSKKHPTPEQKSKLKNESDADVPSVTLRRALKEFQAGDVKRADELWNMVKDARKET